MFALVSSNLAGESVLDWSEKTLRGTHSQPGAQTFEPPLNSVLGVSNLARR
jgi:hypothetical protein